MKIHTVHHATPSGLGRAYENNLINPRLGTVIPVGDPQAFENHAEVARTGRRGDMLAFYQKRAA